MKAKELMDKEFVYLNCEDSVVEVSKVMEEIRRFTCPVVNDNKQLVGWITSFDITRGLREGNDKIIEIMSSYEEITTIHEDSPARLAVILTANNKFVTLYKAMQNQLKGVTWEELMDASALVSQKTTGKKISPEEYEANIMDSTFGEAIWATGGLEKFFAGLISVGELVIARKVGRARK